MPFSNDQLTALVAAANALDFNANFESIADFATRVLGLTEAQQMAFFGDPDSNELLRATNALSNEADRLLNFQGEIPAFGILVTTEDVDWIAGFGTALIVCGAPEKVAKRLESHTAIRTALRGIVQGYDLEAIAAAILARACGSASATKGSGDQGIDVFGSQALLSTHPLFASFADNALEAPIPSWEKVFFLASSKANLGNDPEPDVINPAYIRELIGGWIIQRTPVGHWNGIGILPLSALQVILVTTYRVSAPARQECRRLGAQIWSLSELIFLIAKHAPDEVFGEDGESLFDAQAFADWWSERDQARLSEEDLAALLGGANG